MTDRCSAPLGSLIALSAVLLACVSAAEPTEPAGPGLSALEREAFERVNAHRKASRLAPLAYDERVAAIARRHSEKMASAKVGLGHDGFSARVDEMAKFIQLAGAAENVSKHRRDSDFAEFAVTEWLASPVHRKNIDGDYGITGVGAARSTEGTVYFTQLFVRPR